MSTEAATCCVAGYGCLAPSGSDERVRTFCVACGEVVCTACSRRTLWHRLNRRLCLNCIADGKTDALAAASGSKEPK